MIRQVNSGRHGAEYPTRTNGSAKQACPALPCNEAGVAKNQSAICGRLT
nr:hypothetical protein [Bacteroides intestinalis]